MLRRTSVGLCCLLLVALSLCVTTATDVGTVVDAAGSSPVTDWTWQNPLPQGNNLYGVWGSSAHDVYAVGESGNIAHYDGVRWSSIILVDPYGNTPDLYDVWG